MVLLIPLTSANLSTVFLMGALRFRRGQGGQGCVPRSHRLVKRWEYKQLPTTNWHWLPKGGHVHLASSVGRDLGAV